MAFILRPLTRPSKSVLNMAYASALKLLSSQIALNVLNLKALKGHFSFLDRIAVK